MSSRPVYVSLTSLQQHQTILLSTLASLEAQTYRPTRVFIYVSEQPYLKDKGFTHRQLNLELANYIKTHPLFEICWCENMGSYRKLLPLLKDKWNEDCLIITVDDDTVYDRNLVQRYVDNYQFYGCCVTNRGFTMKFSNSIRELSYENRKHPTTERCLYNFHTGKGGVVYHPSLFYKTGDLIFNQGLYMQCCPTADDVWFNFCRIANGVDCVVKSESYMLKDNTIPENALCINYNNVSGTNTTYIQKIVSMLIDLKYLQETSQVLKFDSGRYWEHRYQSGHHSGQGSRGRLAQFKADVINDFIATAKYPIQRLIDFGMGDGNQLQSLQIGRDMQYLGLDVSSTAVEICRQKFRDLPNLNFEVDTGGQYQPADLVLSCDVLFHLIEDAVYDRYLDRLFTMSQRYVIIYARDEDCNHQPHVKFRKFTSIIRKKYPQWFLLDHIPNRYPQLRLGQQNHETSPCDFYIYECIDKMSPCVSIVGGSGAKGEFSDSYAIKCDYWDIQQRWCNYIEAHLLPLINVRLEGNLYSRHLSRERSDLLISKQENLIRIMPEIRPEKVLEIGFNAGFSALLMLMSTSEIDLTCIDINHHAYVVPCFERICKDYPQLHLVTENSHIALGELVQSGAIYDLIHIDGDHSPEGVQQDLEYCLRLSHPGTIIIMDDTNIKHINDICEAHIASGHLVDFSFGQSEGSTYKHRFLAVV